MSTLASNNYRLLSIASVVDKKYVSPSNLRVGQSPALTMSRGICLLKSQRSYFTGSCSFTVHEATSLLKASSKQRYKRTAPVASLFGVGAPEFLVIGVVALLVFGPKGLAEVARNLGQTLRQFQPTIRELQDISRDFKSTLEQEIGLDELRQPPVYKPQRTINPLPADLPAVEGKLTEKTAADGYPDLTSPAVPKAFTADDYARVTEEQTKLLVPEELRKASEAAAWGGVPPAQKLAETKSVEASSKPVVKSVTPDVESK